MTEEVIKTLPELFHETHTYTPDLFEENFVRPKENEEGLAS